MKFSEYLTKRKSSALTALEHEILGIKKRKGYVKRHADLEITDEQLQKLSEALQSNSNVSKVKMGRVMSMTKDYEVTDSQYLYFMINEIGRTKIGISKDPLKRARAITTGSGMLVKCLKSWKMEDTTALAAEQAILKRYVQHKTFGEWFVEGTLTVERVDSFLIGNEYVTTVAYEDYETKNEMEFYDTLNIVEIAYQTEKAYLFDCGDYKMWCPKKVVKRIDKSTGVVKFVKGKLKEFNKIYKEPTG